MSSIRRFLEQLHRRSVWQVLVTYVGLSWLVLEIAEHLIGQWGLPEQAYPIALLCLLVGLPFIIATSWIQQEPWQKPPSGPTTPAETSGPHPPLHEAPPASTGQPSADGASTPDQGWLRPAEVFTWRNAFIFGLGVMGFWLFSAIGFISRGGTPGEPAVMGFPPAWPSVERDERGSIFVSMFRDLSGNGSHAHVAEGITEELIHELSHIDGLRVPSFTSADALRETPMRPPELAELLDVGHLLEGTVAAQGDSLRVIVQMINAEADSHEWSLDFSGTLDDVFSLRQRIAGAVADSVAGHLSLPARGAQPDRLAESPAHEAYLDGRKALARRTSAGIREAIAAFDLAIAQDSTYVPALAGLSSAYALSITYHTRLPVFAYSAAGYSWRLASRAIELGPGHASGFASRGYVASLSFAPTSVVLPDFQRAMDLEPDGPQVQGWYAHLLVREGRIEEALGAAQSSAGLSPLAPGRRLGVAFAALHARDYELAVNEAREASRLAPDLDLARVLEARALLLAGRAGECLDVELGPYVATRALCLHAIGEEQESARIVGDLRRLLEAGEEVHPDYSVVLPTEDLAVFYAGTGQAELSIEWLERTFSLSPSGVDKRIVESGLFDAVLDTPGFRDDLQRMREGAWSRVARLANADQIDLSGS